jgi:nucleotide-binding universal stress UspA family protein
MVGRLLLCVDDTQRSFQALENLGTLFLEGDGHFHILHVAPESSLPLRHPTSAETVNWETVEKRQVERVLGRAVSSLVQMGYKRSRLNMESRLGSVNTAREILEASREPEIAAIVLARKGGSVVKRFLSGTTTAEVCQYGDRKPVWMIGHHSLRPPHILAAVDESNYADRIVAHLADTIGLLPETRITLFHIMPAKPPGYWDDGHILNKSERSGREALVAQWRWRYEILMGATFAKARGVLTRAGVAEERITTRMQTRVRGIARDILAEVSRGGYNILAFGRRGSGSSELSMGSRATKILETARDCTLILVS